MNVFRGLQELPSKKRPAAVTIGNFYALHRGHLALVRKVRRLAGQVSGISTAVTFEPHPGEVLHGQSPELLITPERKLELLETAGIQETLVLPFNKDLSTMEPEEFVDRILVDGLKMKALVVGVNFRFGHFARGDVTMLRSLARQDGFAFVSARLAQVGGRSISSTAIRHALGEGDLDWANKALGRPFSLPGRVVRGSGRGRKLGYPTANLDPAPNLCVPGPGIYAGHLLAEGDRMPAAISVGTNPTFGPGPRTVEAYILDFSGDLYGEPAEIEFNVRLRDHVAFSGAEELEVAIADDVRRVKEVLGSKRRSRPERRRKGAAW